MINQALNKGLQHPLDLSDLNFVSKLASHELARTSREKIRDCTNKLLTAELKLVPKLKSEPPQNQHFAHRSPSYDFWKQVAFVGHSVYNAKCKVTSSKLLDLTFQVDKQRNRLGLTFIRSTNK